MKILISIPWFKPAFKAGGPIRSIDQLVRLTESDFNFSIICGDMDVDGSGLSLSSKNQFLPYSKNCKVAYLSGERRIVNYKKLTDESKPDVAYIIGLYGWYFMLYPLLFLSCPRKIISVRGMLHPGALTQKKWKKSIYLFFLKKIINPNKISFHATDTFEADLIKRHFGNKFNIHVASNIPEQIMPAVKPQKVVGSISLLSVCLISPMKNILPVLQSLMDCKILVEYTIVGPVKDDQYWIKCLKVINSLPTNVTINIIGEVVPEQLHQHYTQSHVFILPSKSENYGHAIIEALQHGLPVITSNFTPWNQLSENKAGLNIGVSSQEIQFACQYFADMNDEIYKNWSEGAIKYASEKLDIDQIRKEYQGMFTKIF